MAQRAVTLDFSKAQPLQAPAPPQASGVTLDFSKAVPIKHGAGATAPAPSQQKNWWQGDTLQQAKEYGLRPLLQAPSGAYAADEFGLVVNGAAPPPMTPSMAFSGLADTLRQEAARRQAQADQKPRVPYPGEGRTLGLDPAAYLTDIAGNAADVLAGMTSGKNLAIAGAAIAAPEIVLPVLAGEGVATALQPRQEGETSADLWRRRLFAGAQTLGTTAGTLAALRGGLAATNTGKAAVQARSRMRQMTGREISPAKAEQVPAAAAFQQALRNTPAEVLRHAQAEGIALTPAQATGSPLARSMQAVGERSIVGGQKLADAMNASRAAFGEAVNRFQERVDPYRIGLSDEAAGEHLQSSARLALDIAKENAAKAYQQAAIDQANLAGNVDRLRTFAHKQLMVRQPSAAVARPVYHSPAVRAALKDVADAPARLGKDPSIQSMRNLRTEFWEKGNDYSGTIPDAARGIYKQAAKLVDDAIVDAARGTPFEESFRAASEQWKSLESRFNQSGKPLQRLLTSQDPAAALRSILSRSSAADIGALKAEGIDLGPLQRRVVEDIARKGFRVTRTGLGGYSHSFLRTLFGDAALKELYLKGEIGRRLGWEVNPSGTSNVLLTADQISKPWKLAQWMGVAKASMPRPAGQFLPQPLRAMPPAGPRTPIGSPPDVLQRAVRAAQSGARRFKDVPKK